MKERDYQTSDSDVFHLELEKHFIQKPELCLHYFTGSSLLIFGVRKLINNEFLIII